MQERSSRGFVLIAIDGILSGFTAVDSGKSFVAGGDCEIMEIVVSPKFQRQSIARQLVQSSLDILKDRGCKRVGIEIGLYNRKSKSLFGNFGFEFYGRNGIWDEYYKEL